MNRLPLAVLSLVLVTACGSTVQVQSTSTGTQPDGLGGTSGGTTTGGATTGGTVGGGSSSTSGLSGPVGTTGGAGSSSGGARPQTPATTGTSGGTTSTGTPVVAGAISGRGFTKTTIRVGVGTADDYNGVAGSFGLKGVGYDGDPNAWLKAVADDINARGGLAGRKIELVKHNYSTAQLLNDPASAHQAACTTWTQDKPVAVALLAGIGVENTLLTCMAKAKTPVVYPGAGLDYPLHYRQSYAQFPLFFNLAQMVGERYDRIAIDRLVARKFFAPWDTRNGRPGTAATPTKIGLIGFDDPDGGVQLASQQRELSRHGLKAASVIRCPRALTNKISCQQSAVLRMSSNQVTHVFGSDTIFMNNANSQGYRPRYFVAVSAAAFAANVSANQLGGAMGEGYIPFYDVDAGEYPGDPTPATAACKALMRKAGQASTNTSTLALQMAVCDEFSFVKAAVDAVGALGAEALKAGLERLGGSQQSALTWKSFLGPGEHTSAQVLRDLEYRSDIQRFVYVSKTNHGDK